MDREHDSNCQVALELADKLNRPKRFRVRIPDTEKHPNGSTSRWRYGCYFPLTDLVIGDMGGRGTGKPTDVEWVDQE